MVNDLMFIGVGNLWPPIGGGLCQVQSLTRILGMHFEILDFFFP